MMNPIEKEVSMGPAEATDTPGKPYSNKPLSQELKVVGLCLGASTVTMVRIASDQKKSDSPPKTPASVKIVEHSIHTHEGDPKGTLLSALEHFNVDSFDRIVATGRRFRNFLNMSSIPEPEAVEYAYQFVKPPGTACPAIVSAGGETTMAYVLNRRGQISNVLTGNKCASGTGEFFLQQLRRMNVSLETAEQWANTETPYAVSGRCSVFCKSDCTHATNKGIPKANVTAGLCKMMAGKILELLKKVERRNIMIVGGTARNRMMIRFLREEISGLIVPEEAPYFEALGAALWGLHHEVIPFPGESGLFVPEVTSFDSLSPLKDFEKMVEFKSMDTGAVCSGEEYILGLDVGSTTTKAVLLKEKDSTMVASIYLRTDGDPVGASRRCYRSILDQVARQIDPASITISALGVCGSGRQIAGLHALTDGVINEIIAHAAAAVYFDPQVDTIFEIGGQDAKYTHVTNGVPSDYAMNEACSAGTGSFLEESAYETLGIKMEDIAEIAIKGTSPPNFNDQCAAFIASDIKNAIHEGIKYEDIITGLVYSICMNYSNRVKGNRPVGEKVFMQGGVCYNKAIPLAMAALVGKPIIVPPEPGLMGAFGVALEVGNRIESGLLRKKRFDLQVLADRHVKYKKPFNCKGGKEKCDRGCEIAVIEIEGDRYPFGGACNRYYNLRHKIRYDVGNLDLVRLRQRLVFEKYGAVSPGEETKKRGRIGINRSFLVNTYYPLYATFFGKLGFEVVLPDLPLQKGIDQKNAAFCYPGELAHGYFYSLIQMKNPPDFIFLPHFKAVPAQDDSMDSQVCPFVQGETFFLQTTFQKRLAELKRGGIKILTPLIDLRKGLKDARAPLIEAAMQAGVSRKEGEEAFKSALQKQVACMAEMQKIGRATIRALESDADRTAVVIFARPYNGFVDEAHMGIPCKFASRGMMVIPFDFIPFQKEDAKRHMYWGMGQMILKASNFVKRHPQLFGTYITNFSCGPDSFIIGYFRDIMGRKPSLTLELDSHTADAGIETRVEAFLDIIAAYRQLISKKENDPPKKAFIPARMRLHNGVPEVVTSAGETLPMNDDRVTVLFPSMGQISTESLAAVFRGKGFHVVAHPPADDTVLKIGRANTSCKECLPLILTTGTLLNYIHNGRRKKEVLVYFMPTGSGPCRFGQYYIFMEDLIRRFELPDVAILSLSSENSYAGLGADFQKKGWWAVVVADMMEDIRSMLLANAADTDKAMQIFSQELNTILGKLETSDFLQLEKQLYQSADRFRRISLQRSFEDVPKILLTGEIFVRRDGLSRQYLTERLAEKGFAVVCSPVSEWLFYSDYLVDKGLADYKMSKIEKLAFIIKKRTMAKYEKRIKSVLSFSGLVHNSQFEIRTVIENATPYISPALGGEAILTIGSSLTEIVSHVCGVIAIGPFGCMPNRMSESILNEVMTRENKLSTDPGNKKLENCIAGMDDLPFLSIESDGSPFPQLIHAKLETFCLRAGRLQQKMGA